LKKEAPMPVPLMRTIIAFAFVGFLVNLSACAPIGATRFPEPSATFVPRKEYAAPFENVWKAVNGALDNNRIAVAATNRDEGRITTEYVQGQSQVVVTAVSSTRYKYAIRVFRKDTTTTTINVVAYLESSGGVVTGRGGPVGGAWRDVSNDNKVIVAKLENWLYEQIQTAIMK
jgi:NlpB/DapX lipoprotein